MKYFSSHKIPPRVAEVVGEKPTDKESGVNAKPEPTGAQRAWSKGANALNVVLSPYFSNHVLFLE